MRRFEPLAKLVSHFESKAESKSDRVTRYKKFGLCIFVAVPHFRGPALDGSSHRRAAGYETEDSFPVITLGVCIASLVVTGITYGFISLF